MQLIKFLTLLFLAALGAEASIPCAKDGTCGGGGDKGGFFGFLDHPPKRMRYRAREAASSPEHVAAPAPEAAV